MHVVHTSEEFNGVHRTRSNLLGEQCVAAGIDACPGLQIELEVVGQAVQNAVRDDGADGQILARVRAVPTDLIRDAAVLNDDALVVVAPSLVRFDRPQRRLVGVLQQADEVVVVAVWVSTRPQTQ